MTAVGAPEPRRRRSGRRGQKHVLPAASAAKRDRGRRHAARSVRGVISLGRALGKRHLRVIAIDDGPFQRRQRSAVVAAVGMTVPGSVDGILATRVRVDGTDATDRIVELLRRSPHLAGSRAILVDGISVAGFNVLDLDRISRALGRPVVSITRQSPDLSSIRQAIRKYFPRDARRRIRLVERHPPAETLIGVHARWIAAVGANRAEARRLVERTTLVGAWPEPLRVARLVARAIAEDRAPPTKPSPRRKGAAPAARTPSSNRRRA